MGLGKVDLEGMQVGKPVPTTSAQIVVEVQKGEDSAHFAPIDNLEEMLRHR